MPIPIAIESFRGAYRAALQDVLPLLTDERLELVAAHNPGWKPGAFDFAAYLRASEERYVRALGSFARGGGRLDETTSVLDVGGFMAAFPLALARLGARVTLAERYDYYGDAFDELCELVRTAGVTVWDADFSSEQVDGAQSFDLVTCMAVLEHLPDSPRRMLANLRACAAAVDGTVLVEVPNIAYWPKRMAALRGESVLPPLANVYDAQPPFTGHHREYTAADLRSALDWAGFGVEELETFNYTPARFRGLARLLEGLPRAHLAGAREVLLARARPRDAAADGFPRPRENAYGSLARLEWIERNLPAEGPVLEVGCGTGTMLTLPLAAVGRDVRGLDLDHASIHYGRSAAARAGLDPEILSSRDLRELDERFAAIIVSEVLEHQDDAGVDGLLDLVCDHLEPGGLLFVTVPNGYGWFELESFLWFRARLGGVLQLLRLDRVVRMLKRRAIGDYVDMPYRSTLDSSPHLQRFTFGSIRRRLRAHGLTVRGARGSVLFGGPFSNLLFTGIEPAMRANVKLGERLPRLAAGFFVLAEKAPR